MKFDKWRVSLRATLCGWCVVSRRSSATTTDNRHVMGARSARMDFAEFEARGGSLMTILEVS
jgi:hypothetical protein